MHPSDRVHNIAPQYEGADMHPLDAGFQHPIGLNPIGAQYCTQ